MQGLDLGRAFFKVGLDSVEAVRGLTDFGNKTASTTAKIVPGFKNVAQGISSVDDKFSAVQRGMDRFSRGLRGISPELAASRENMYRIEDAQKRLSRELEVAKLRLEEKQQAEQRNLDTTKLLSDRLELASSKLKEQSSAILDAKAKLDELRTSTTLHNQNLQTQTEKTAKAGQEYDLYKAKVAETVAKLQQLKDAQANNAAEEAKLQATIDRVTASYKNFADQAAVATTKLKQMQEVNPTAELNRESARLREITIDYEQAKIKAGQYTQALSTLVKQGISKQDPAYRDAKLAAQAEVAARDRLLQTITTQTTRVDQLKIKSQEYNHALKEQESLVGVLSAKSSEELARSQAMAGELTILKQKHADINTTIERRQQELVKLQREEQELLHAYQAEVQALDTLKTASGADAKAIADQEKKVNDLSGSYDRQRLVVANLQHQIEGSEQRQQRLATETASQDRQVKNLTESESRYGAQLELAKSRIQAITERLQRKKEKQEALKAKMDATSDSTQKQGGLFGWLSGIFGHAASSADHFGSAEQRITGITQAVNQRLFSLGSIIRDVLVGSLASFVGNTLSNWATGLRGVVATGLDAYKAHEMLGLSLKALSQRELVATGAFKNIHDAESKASDQSEKLIHWMEQLAILSPFSVDDISGAFRLGNALGFTSSQARRLIQDTVDWASATGGTGQSIESVIRAMGQMHNTGHVTLEDLNQMTDAGLSARDILRNEFAPEIKKSGKSLEDLISDGVLPADRAIRAMAMSMEKDFGGAAANAGTSMTGLLASLSDIKNAGLRELFSSTFEAIKTPLNNLVTFLQSDEALGAIQQFGAMLGSSIGQALSWLGTVAFPAVIDAARTFGPEVLDAFSFLAALVSEAYAWGRGIGEQFAEGLSDTIDYIVSIVMSIADTISGWMEPHSPPKFLPEIDVWGRKTGQMWGTGFSQEIQKTGAKGLSTYFKDWSEGDFGLFDAIRSQLKNNLDSLAEVGRVKPESVAQMVFGSQELIARAVEQFRKTGVVSEQVFRAIRVAAGPAGAVIESYTRALLRSSAANEALRKAQEKLTNITAAYDAQLSPLEDKLNRLRSKGDIDQRAKEIKQLQELLAAPQIPGLEIDRGEAKRQLDILLTEQQIAQVQSAKETAQKKAQAQIDAAAKAADAAKRQLDIQEELIAQQKEQNDLIKQQIELEKGKNGDPAEQAKRDAEAKKRYDFEHMSTEEQLKDLQRQQAQQRKGSAEWYDLQDQIEAKQGELQRELEQADKKKAKAEGDADKAQKKAETEAEKQHKAEYEARLAAAQTEEERLQIMEEEQARYADGSAEYLKLQKSIEQQKDKVASASAKASKQEFDHSLAMADSADKVALLQKRLEELDPASEEYAQRQEQLKKAQEEQTKSVDKLSDAEFEAKLATQDRAGKIEMLKNRLGELDQGSMKYEQTLKRLNTLERQETDKAAGGGAGGAKKKGKPGVGGGGPFEGLADLGEKMHTVGNSMSKVSDAVERAKTSFSTFKAKLDPVFAWLRANSGPIVFVLQKLALSFVVAVAMEKLVKPILMLVGGLKSFLTFGNAAWLLIAFLGYAWKNNLGGLRDIVLDVWGKIQKPLEALRLAFGKIADAFKQGGIAAAWEEIKKQFETIAKNIGLIGGTIWDGIKKWVGPLVKVLSEVFMKVVAWVQSGGLSDALHSIFAAVGNLFNQSGGDAALIGGILGLIGGIGLVLQTVFVEVGKLILANLPELVKGLTGLLQAGRDWLAIHGSELWLGAGAAITLALAGVFEALIPGLKVLILRLVDLASVLVPEIPNLVSGLLTIIMEIGAWLIGRGIPLLLSNLLEITTYSFNKLGQMLPSLGLNLGRLIGSTISKVLIMLVVGLAGLIGSVWASVQDGTIIPKIKAFGNSILNVFIGLLKGAGGILLGIVIGLFEPFADIGRSILDGVGSGLDSGWKSLIESFLKSFDDLVASVKSFLGIASPSTLFASIGQAIVDGLLAGLQFLTKLAETVIGWLLSMQTRIIIGFQIFTANFIAGALAWEAQVLAGIDTFVTRFLEFITQLTLKVVQILIDFFADLLGKFGVNRDDIIGVVTDLHDKFLEFIGKIDTGVRSTIAALATWWKTTTTQTKDALVTTVTGLKTDITRIVGNLEIAISTTWGNIKTTATTKWGELVTSVKTAFAPIVSTVETIANSIKTTLFGGGSGGIIGDIGSSMDTIWQSIADGVADKIRGIKTTLFGDGNGGIVGEIKSSMKRMWESIADTIGTAFSGAEGKVKDAINRVIDKVNDAIDSINNVSSTLGLPSLPYIDRLAIGAMAARGGLTLVGENGPELVRMPRGAEVLTAGRTFSVFDNTARAFTRQAMHVLDQSNQAMIRTVDRAARQIVRATAVKQGGGTDKSHVEHHDHYHLTVHSQATTPTVVQDFRTMRSLAGL